LAILVTCRCPTPSALQSTLTRSSDLDPCPLGAEDWTRADTINAYVGPPTTPGNTVAAITRAARSVTRLQPSEPDPAEMTERYRAEMTVPDWHTRLACGSCGSRRVEMVVTCERQ
jgi:hypothetical protein